ncbi:MAG: [FeFe] hydrogenase H-cluster maturation GTPase HydF [Eubacteriales bacterium]|nr:[FeFe] hydrogenase H-cluster maturation GTPase HydF [Eubacteriales bacterium]
MGMNSIPSAERVHIGIFGKRNSGKSSLINAMTGQRLSIVSEVKGTTTDPVQKAMELLPLGPVVLIDTPGIDDEGALGAMRVGRSLQMLNKSDMALLVLDAGRKVTEEDKALLARIRAKKIPCMIALNQCDLFTEQEINRQIQETKQKLGEEAAGIQILPVSASSGYHITELKEALAGLLSEEEPSRRIAADLIIPGKLTILVIPIDKAAPKGRLILPQQQTIRDILEAGGACLVVRDTELSQVLSSLEGQVGLVITDSQAFGAVSRIVPEGILLTSFSILFARYKGELEPLLSGVGALEELKDGDRVLISEGCTHHRQCDDIGTVKIPGWISAYTGKKLHFSFTSGGEFPSDLSSYGLIVHCGGCMLNAREMRYRIACALDAGVPITNYGMLIASIKGILERSLAPVRGKQ